MAMHPNDQEEKDILSDLIARTAWPEDYPAVSTDTQLELLRQRDRYRASSQARKAEYKCPECGFEGMLSIVQGLFHSEGRCTP